ncbi:MAG: TetR/AcrR family transcriptional regulator [Pseudomonadota bacterium]|nr:TetR/AcrR family transcriptional regulator [Pseudomonadota bacterium]
MSQLPDRARKKPRLSREQQKAARLQDLLGAARTLFREKGYEAVSIDQVAEYAGCSRMPVYTLFGDRHNLVFELWRSTTADVEQSLFKHFVAGTSLRTNLKQLAELLSDSLNSEKVANDSERLFFVVQTISQSRPDIAEKVSTLARSVIQDVAKFIERCSLTRNERLRSDAETVASHLVAYINGLATVQFQTHSRNIKAKDLIPIFNAIVFKDT